MLTINIIGAGRLGKTLAKLAQQSGRYRIGAVLCRSLTAAQQACAFIGGGEPCDSLQALPAANLTLLAVPDGAIASVAAELAASGGLAAGSVAFHASGVGEAALLAPLAAQGVLCASLHPAFSFAEPARAVQGFAGTRCALEGDAAAFPSLQDFANAIGGVPFALAPGGKAAYHAALSIASNYLVTLHDLASRVAAQAGMTDEVAAAVLGGLMRQTLENTLTLGPQLALTGPIARGDAGTVAKHRAVLSTQDDALYCALGQATARLAATRLDASVQAGLQRVLQPALKA
ncbi:Rossmann-like and DUF2520 domain-containing protein [Vogesella oryzae]|uniref:Rossmann-like and DUF2520 domain-containing protein n=1 Tax=Vogesella oryzae TaxID=1735285 RepID=UPI0015819B2B|nr:Rossmann-like and DUF2520 domain-containing protein [Vogesella oryzae]